MPLNKATGKDSRPYRGPAAFYQSTFEKEPETAV
jgi:hypothetical protein